MNVETITATFKHCNSPDLFTPKKRLILGFTAGTVATGSSGSLTGRLGLCLSVNTAPQPIKDLPDDYLNWTLQNVELKNTLRRVLEIEYERRGRTAA
jgi:hypothetical protein